MTFIATEKKSASSKTIEENIYINDRLTNFRKGLFYASRQLFKRKILAATWTQHGNVLVRKELSDEPRQISTYKDLEEFNPKETLQNCNILDEIGSDSASIKTHITDYDFSELSETD